MPRSNENTSLSHIRKPATTPSTPVLISTSVSTSTSSSSFYSSTSKDLSSTVPWYLPTPKMDDKLKKINESQKKRIIFILNVGRGGGGKTAVGVSKLSPGEVKPETVLILCIHIFSTGFGQFSSMYSIIEEIEEIFL